MATLSDFAARHWVLGGIAASLLWFVAGKESKHNIGPLWRGVGVAILLVMCGWTIAEKEWLGLVTGVAVLYWEMRSIRRSETQTKTQ